MGGAIAGIQHRVCGRRMAPDLQGDCSVVDAPTDIIITRVVPGQFE
jgi:hypothetical protein